MVGGERAASGEVCHVVEREARESAMLERRGRKKPCVGGKARCQVRIEVCVGFLPGGHMRCDVRPTGVGPGRRLRRAQTSGLPSLGVSQKPWDWEVVWCEWVAAEAGVPGAHPPVGDRIEEERRLRTSGRTGREPDKSA